TGPGTVAHIQGPNGLALGPGGGIFFVEYSNQRVLRLATDGTLSPVAGTGGCSSSGDQGPATSAGLCSPRGIAYDATRGRLYIADSAFGRVRVVEVGTG